MARAARVPHLHENVGGANARWQRLQRSPQLCGAIRSCVTAVAARSALPSAAAAPAPYRLLPPPSRCGFST